MVIIRSIALTLIMSVTALHAAELSPAYGALRKIGCTSIVEKYPDSGQGGLAPLILGLDSGNNKVRAEVVWCKANGNSYYMAFLKNGRLAHSRCPAYFKWYENPQGLKVVTERMDLSRFNYVQDVNKRDGRGSNSMSLRREHRIYGETSGEIIKDGADPSNYFYCYGRRWVVFQAD